MKCGFSAVRFIGWLFYWFLWIGLDFSSGRRRRVETGSRGNGVMETGSGEKMENFLDSLRVIFLFYRLLSRLVLFSSF